jgi:D-arabinose 1-dehydrogenase-like Zn-dependent alcohol dehydrogenase
MTLQGSYVGSLGEAKELLELVAKARIPAVPITTRPLDEADAALQALRAGKVIGRAVLTP